MILNAVRAHHERWDGEDLPDGLLDHGTPFAARVVGIADVYDEAVNPTPKRDAFSHEDAIAMISPVSGRVVGPDLVKHLRKSFASGAPSREIIQGPPGELDKATLFTREMRDASEWAAEESQTEVWVPPLRRQPAFGAGQFLPTFLAIFCPPRARHCHVNAIDPSTIRTNLS